MSTVKSNPSHIQLMLGVYNEKMRSANYNGFSKFEFENKQPHRREVQIYEALMYQKISPTALYGLFSTSYPDRIDIDGTEIKNIITRNPGFDIYLFSPAQYNHVLWFDIWDQAEAWHPGIRAIADKIFEAMGIPLTNSIMRQPSLSCYCNYWVANGLVFKKIINKMLNVEHVAQELSLDHEQTFWISPVQQTWNQELKKDNRFIPFILERLVSHLLITESEFQKLKVFSWQDRRKYSDQVEKIPVFQAAAQFVLSDLDDGETKLERKSFYTTRWKPKHLQRFAEIWPWIEEVFPVHSSQLSDPHD